MAIHQRSSRQEKEQLSCRADPEVLIELLLEEKDRLILGGETETSQCIH
jgi:hypothetical protein